MPGNERKGRITIVGSICQDLVVTVPHLPARGETVLSRSFETFVGGKGFNQALQAHRLEAEINFFGKLGADIYGDDVIRQLNDEGFPGAGIARTGSHTALGIIMVEDGGMNYIAGFSGANMEFKPDDIDRVALADALSQSSHLILLYFLDYIRFENMVWDHFLKESNQLQLLDHSIDCMQQCTSEGK